MKNQLALLLDLLRLMDIELYEFFGKFSLIEYIIIKFIINLISLTKLNKC